jgi:hypothetical protein
MTRYSSLFRTALFSVIILSTGCSEQVTAVPAEAGSIRGLVTAVYPQSVDPVMRVLVADLATTSGPQPQTDAIGIIIFRSTRVSMKEPSGAIRPASIQDIRVGSSVEAFHTGVVRHSGTPQLTATRIVVTRGEN